MILHYLRTGTLPDVDIDKTVLKEELDYYLLPSPFPQVRRHDNNKSILTDYDRSPAMNLTDLP